MPRIFQNVSPFGDLVTLGRIVKHGETVTTYDDGLAEGLAEQPLNWLEVDADGTPAPAPAPVPEVTVDAISDPVPDIPAEPDAEPIPAADPAPEADVAAEPETKSKK